METLIGFCKLCGRDMTLKNYMIVHEAKDCVCVISDGRAHELLFGKRADTARRVEDAVSRGFVENSIYRDTGNAEPQPVEPETTMSYEDLPDHAGPEEIR